MEAFWQHFYDMSERGRGRRGGTPQPGGTPNPTGRSRGGADPYPVPPGQWKQCCDELMRIEVPPPRRPPAMLPRQGSLYHEMGERWGRGGLGGLCLCLLPFCSPLTFCQAAPSSPPWHLPNVAVLSTASLSPPSLSLSPPPPHLRVPTPAFLCPLLPSSVPAVSLCRPPISPSPHLRWLQPCPARLCPPPPAKGSCCRITPSRRRSELCSPPITATGDGRGAGGVSPPCHGPWHRWGRPWGWPGHGAHPGHLGHVPLALAPVRVPAATGHVPGHVPAVGQIPATLATERVLAAPAPVHVPAMGHIHQPWGTSLPWGRPVLAVGGSRPHGAGAGRGSGGSPADPPLFPTAIDPADDIEAVTDILTRRAGGRVPGTPPWVSLFEGPPPRAPRSGRAGSPSPPARRPWGRPRTLSLDAKLSTLKGRGSRQAAHPPRPSPPSSGSSSSGSSSPVTDHNPPMPPSPLQSRV